MSADEGPTFRLLTLGSTVLEKRDASGAWETVMRASKPLAVLIRLAAVPGRSLPREQMADSLWGDESPERARASLRQAVYALKQIIGEDIVQSEREVLTLPEGVLWTDRDVFVAAMRRNDLDGMLSVYGGAFCDALSVGASEYERWMRAERSHIERLLLDRAQSVVPTRIAAGETDSALAAARLLERHLGDRSEVQVMLFDALVAAGERLEAVERLSQHASRLSAEELSIPPQIAERIARVRRAALEPTRPQTASLALVGQQLIGRDALLQELLREAEVARGGGPRRLVLNGPAGVGKTRVLDELEARLRLRGARVVRVAFLPSMQEVEYAALVEFARAVCVLPGALGISEHSARALLRVVPELRDRFPGAARDATAREAARVGNDVRSLQGVVSDLLSSVAEDRLVVVMIDNLQYADAATLTVLTGTQLNPSSRLLELWTSRLGRELPQTSAMTVIDVMPLAEPDVMALFEAVAKVPDEAWMHTLAGALFRRSAGVPLLVLSAIRSLGAAGLLRIERGSWTSERPDELLKMARATAGTAALVAAVDAVSRLALLVLAAWGRPMEEKDLIGTLSPSSRGVAADEWRASLRRLESLGLVQSRDVTWAIAHDSVADELRATPSSVVEDSPREMLFNYWTADSRLSLSVLEQIALMAGQEESSLLAVRLARVAAKRRRLRQSGLRGRELAHRIAMMAGHPEWERDVQRGVGFFARQTDAVRLALSLSVLLVATGLIVVAGLLQPRVVVESVPMVEFSEPGDAAELVVQPRVRIANAFGRPLSLNVPVRVDVDHGSLVGETRRDTKDGLLQFEGLSMVRGEVEAAPRPVHVLFHGPWWVRSARAEVPGISTANDQDHFRIVELKANGMPVGDELIITAGLDDSIRFDLTFEYTTVHPTANYIVGAAPTWGERKQSAIRLAGLPRPVRTAWRHVNFAVPPARAVSDEYVIILMDLEDTVDHMFSSTSWAQGAPVWNDGNDVVDSPRAVFEALRVRGASDGEAPLRGRAVLVRFR